jgi:hypothetical protein
VTRTLGSSTNTNRHQPIHGQTTWIIGTLRSDHI